MGTSCFHVWHQLCDQGASFVCLSLLALCPPSLFMQAAVWMWLARGVASGVECMHLLPAVAYKLGKLHLSLPSYTIMCELTPLSIIYTPILQTTYTSWCNYCTLFLNCACIPLLRRSRRACCLGSAAGLKNLLVDRFLAASLGKQDSNAQLLSTEWAVSLLGPSGAWGTTLAISDSAYHGIWLRARVVHFLLRALSYAHASMDYITKRTCSNWHWNFVCYKNCRA